MAVYGPVHIQPYDPQCHELFAIYYSSFFFTHLYIKKKLHSETKSSIYTETYIFDTYIFGTDYTILWSVKPLPFLFI
jgi:hypothetical protein